jgi:release factor glutamine methyltransferase
MEKQELLNIGKKFWLKFSIVEKILLKKTRLNKSQFFLISNIELSEKNLEELKYVFKKVAFGYPIEYVLEKAEFYWLDFFVDKRCLIPRNDTEIMVKEAILSVVENSVYIDIWTWSWAILISVYNNSNEKIKKAYCVDISLDALEVANKNIINHNLSKNIILLESDLLSIFKFDKNLLNPEWSNIIDNVTITANLPYIKNNDFWNMDQEVILHEPALSLYGGVKTGFELYEKLIFQCFDFKKYHNIKNLFLFIEIGFDQKNISINYLENNNLQFEMFKDNWWVERCIKIIF